MTVYVRRIKTETLADLPDALDNFKLITSTSADDDTPIIGTAIEPETDVPIVFIHSTTPVLVLIGGPASADMDYCGGVFPDPYEPPRVRTDRERLPS